MDDALLDVNVLVALVFPQHVHHARVQRWLSAHTGSWCTTPITELALVRLSLNRAVSGLDISAAAALGLVRALRQHPAHRFVPDDGSLAEARIALNRFSTGSQVTDLHLVDLAMRHGVRLVTLDRSIPDMLEPADRTGVEVLRD